MQLPQLTVIPQTEDYGYHFNQIETNGEGLLLHHFLKPNQTVFDIGANAGDWAKYALTVEPTLRVIAFEPVPGIFKQLKENIRFSNAKLYNKAISNYVGTGNFFNTEDFEFGWSSFVQRPDFKSREKTIQVQVDTLDNFCFLNNIEQIDFVKIDVEGSELTVLQGARRLLQEQKISGLQFEYGGTFPDAGITLQEVMKLLTANGYVLFRLFTRGLIHISEWKENLENNNYSNYFAVLQKMAPNFNQMIFS